jgi:CRISPR/Cas system endoribonuclease Cas6 (RAMP superfamily)
MNVNFVSYGTFFKKLTQSHEVVKHVIHDMQKSKLSTFFILFYKHVLKRNILEIP